MQTLLKVQKSFTWIGFDPKLEPFNRRVVQILVITFSAIISLWIYFIRVPDTAQEYMESIFIVSTCTSVFLSFMSAILNMEKLFSFIKGVDEFLTERFVSPTAKATLEKTNELVERYSEIGIFVMKNTFVSCVILPKAIFSFFTYFTTDAGNEAFSLPLPMWLPYDWKNPIGYLITVCMQACLAINPFRYIECFGLLALGVFMFAISFVKIMKDEVRSINEMASDKKSRENMYKKLSEFIQTHGHAKQVIDSFPDLYDIILTIVFVVCIISICAALLLAQIKISHDDTDSIVLLEAVVYGACVILLLLFVCELGQRFSNEIDEIDDVIIQFEWYLFPPEVQRILPTVMLSTQQPVVISCFGNVLCARVQFQKAMNSVYSYFMVLREFYK